MVILGGLELVAAGYLLREHNKNKKERERAEAEEARLRHERRRRRKHDSSPDRPDRPSRSDRPDRPDRPDRLDRPGRSDTKYEYIPPSAMKPSSAGSGLGIPSGPPGRSSSQPPPNYAPPAYSPQSPYPQAQAYGPPVPNQPPPPQGYGYGQYPPGPPPPQPSYPQAPQGPPAPGLAGDYYNPENNFGPGSNRQRAPEPYQRRNSEPDLPVGVAELSADGPWMHDPHRTHHQTPRVRFNFPDGTPQPGDETRSPPPSYRP